MIKNSTFLCFLLFVNISFSQSVDILGKVVSKADVENIHVVNITTEAFAVTDKEGVFKISASTNDTLQFSSVQHGIKNVLVSKENMVSKTMLVAFDEHINQLDEVVVGKALTGDLLKDIENANDDTPINFYDVGIPGYTGKKSTQNEKRLFTAGEFKPIMLLGLLGGSMPLDPVINGISGRTKRIKKYIDLDHRKSLRRKIKSDFSESLFSNNYLDEGLRADFFFFCEDAPDFISRCRGKSDLEVLGFLHEKLKQYKQNLQAAKD